MPLIFNVVYLRSSQHSSGHLRSLISVGQNTENRPSSRSFCYRMCLYHVSRITGREPDTKHQSVSPFRCVIHDTLIQNPHLSPPSARGDRRHGDKCEAFIICKGHHIFFAGQSYMEGQACLQPNLTASRESKSRNLHRRHARHRRRRRLQNKRAVYDADTRRTQTGRRRPRRPWKQSHNRFRQLRDPEALQHTRRHEVSYSCWRA